MSTNPVIAGNQNPLAPDTLGLPVVNIPGMQLPTTSEIINNIPQSGVAKPGHFAQLIVDGPSVFNGAVYFGASQRTAWFDCSPATVDPTVVLDFAGGPQQYLFLTRDTVIWLPTTDQQEGMFFVLVEQALSGPWLLTWKVNNPTIDGSAVVIWLAGEEPVMSAEAGSVRLYTFTWCQNLNGGLGAYVGSSTADFATLGLDADLATLVLPANTTITAAAQTILDDTTVAAMLATLNGVSRLLGNVTDFNTALTDGEYGVGGPCANAPYVGNIFAKLRVLVSDGTTHNNANNWIWQYLDDTSGRAYYRYKVNGGGWNAWLQITTNAVVGPASATDLALVIFDGVTGKLVKNSGVIINGGGTLYTQNMIQSFGAANKLRLTYPSVADIDFSVNSAGQLGIVGGNVGIGTPSPAEKLHVIGNMQVNGQVHIGQYTNGTAYIDAHDGIAFYGCDNQGGMSVNAAGNAGIGNNLYVGGNMSALSITDRTPVYEGDAVGELIKIKGIAGKIDHSTLPTFARHVTTLQVASETEKDDDGKALMVETQEEGRDLGAMISMLTVAIKQLNTRLLAVEKR